MEQKIAENFLLVSLKPDKPGFLVSSEALGTGLLGAVFIELLLNKTIGIKDSYVKVKRLPNSISNPVDGMLHRINRSKKPKKVKFWISKFAHTPRKYKMFFLENMEKKGLIRIDKKRFLFIPYKRTSLVKKKERELKEIKAKLKKLMDSDQISHDVDRVIKEMHAAVIAAVIVSTGATAAISGASG